MLDRVVEQAREREEFSREDTPTEQRVEAALLYHTGFPYRRVERVVGRSYEAVHQWYHQLAHLFDQNPDDYSMIVIGETNLQVEEIEIYVWAAVDVKTFEGVHTKVSPAQSNLDALLFVKQVLQRCRGNPVVFVDRGPWYN